MLVCVLCCRGRTCGRTSGISFDYSACCRQTEWSAAPATHPHRISGTSISLTETHSLSDSGKQSYLRTLELSRVTFSIYPEAQSPAASSLCAIRGRDFCTNEQHLVWHLALDRTKWKLLPVLGSCCRPERSAQHTYELHYSWVVFALLSSRRALQRYFCAEFYFFSQLTANSHPLVVARAHFTCAGSTSPIDSR